MEKRLCRICEAEVKADYLFREMMFGTREEFEYGKCRKCGCIQIINVPDDIGRHYPPYYMSFNQHITPLKRLPFFKRLFSNIRIAKKYKTSDSWALNLLKPLRTNTGARILDIGCGRGQLICSLFNLGFEHVNGVDKFLPHDIDHGFGVKVYNKELSDLPSNSYDLLIMHHVFEHVDEQVQQLQECYRLLKKGGVLLIAVPVLGEPWEIYGRDWVQIDAPRHFVLHTEESMKQVAEQAGFKLNKAIYDSTGFQFWASELYKRDNPLTLPDTHEMYPIDTLFSAAQMAEFEQRAKVLNEKRKGDSARFYLYKDQ
ncbi:MAG: class I SAM-dependent methyltransferase [Mucilaginibacter sp.]|nr:class I SAM-dependent methyltransferase [Mucilaginibacter sp.]